MQVVNKKMCVIVILVLVIIESCTLFLMYKSYGNKNTNLDEVNLNINNSNMFAIMLEQDDGTYKEDTTSTWPTSGYTYNESMSGCIDINGNKLDGVLSYDTSTNIANVNTTNTSYCYLYFSLSATAFAVYSADDSSLTFYKNKDNVKAGQQYKGKTVTTIYEDIETRNETGINNSPWANINYLLHSIVIVDEISPINTSYWFYRAEKDIFYSVVFEGLENIDTSGVIDMSYMFYKMSIETVDGENITFWDTSNVTNVSYMFYELSGTTTNFVNNCINWNVSSVETYNCFCSGLSLSPSYDLPSLFDLNVAYCRESGTDPA